LFLSFVEPHTQARPKKPDEPAPSPRREIVLDAFLFRTKEVCDIVELNADVEPKSVSCDGRSMKPINRFALEKHDGPYEKWPLRSRLSLDGTPTDLFLPGYALWHQFETPGGYILVTDYDCPYEEITNFALFSKDFRLNSCRWLGWMYETFLLERIDWIDERTFIAFIGGSDHYWRLSIRSWGIPYLRPCLKLQWSAQAIPSGGSERTKYPEPGRTTACTGADGK
jgi:hypothetical protein